MTRRGVLLMAYGTPERPEDVEAYYTDIRRGRPPTPEQLADLRRRYDAIGGLSPLAAITRSQRDGLQRQLGDGWVVELGLKHAAPFIEDGAKALLEAGVDDVTGLVLAPHYSALSIGQYVDRLRGAIPGAGAVESWPVEDGLVALLADRLAPLLPADLVLFTAHSLPVRSLELDDPTYPDQLRATAAAVAGRAGVERWDIAFQSAGRTPEPWLGPDLLEVIRGLDAGTRLVVCPAGFTADHLEVLYDIDIEAAGVAAEAGVDLARTQSLNDDPRFMTLLADLIRQGPPV